MHYIYSNPLKCIITRTAIQFYIIQETQHMDGYEFEYQCAKILKRKHFSKIKVTQNSGDQGIDIIAFKHRKNTGYNVNITPIPLEIKLFRKPMQVQTSTTAIKLL